MVLKNEPNRDFFQKSIYGGTDMSVCVVSSETWTSSSNAFWFDEFIYILNDSTEVIAYDKDYTLQSLSYVLHLKDFLDGGKLILTIIIITNFR